MAQILQICLTDTVPTIPIINSKREVHPSPKVIWDANDSQKYRDVEPSSNAVVGSLYPAGVDNPSSDSTLLVVELTITDWLPGVPFYFYAVNEQNERVTDRLLMLYDRAGTFEVNTSLSPRWRTQEVP